MKLFPEYRLGPRRVVLNRRVREQRGWNHVEDVPRIRNYVKVTFLGEDGRYKGSGMMGAGKFRTWAIPTGRTLVCGDGRTWEVR